MAKTDTYAENLIINQMPYATYDTITPSNTEIYLVEEDDIYTHEYILPNKELIGGFGMPANTETTVNLPTSGQTYTATKNGYLCIGKNSSAAGQYVKLTRGHFKDVCYATASGQELCVSIPLYKGQTVTIDYTAAGTTQYCVFIPVLGSV